MILFVELSALNVSGRVVDEDNKPIKDLIVSVGNYAVFSDVNGVFHLTNIPRAKRIYFHKIGYEDKFLLPGNMSLQIVMIANVLEVPGYTIAAKRAERVSLKTTDKIVITNVDDSFSNAADLLRGRAEIKVQGSPLLGNKRTVSLGGNKSKHTLVMLDGVALNMNGEEFDISTIPAAIIDKIEIVQNNAGAIGGNGAIGGIVNIISKNKLDYDSSTQKKVYITNSTDGLFGSFDLRKWQEQISVNVPYVQAFGVYSQASSDNDFEYKNKLTDKTEKRKNNQSDIIDVALMMNTKVNDFNLKYNLLYQYFYKELPGGISTLSMFDHANKKGFSKKERAELSYSTPIINLQTDFYRNSDESEYKNIDSTIPAMKQNNETKYYKTGANFNASYRWEKVINLVLGGNYDKQDFSYQNILNGGNDIGESMDNYAARAAVEVKWNFFPTSYEVAINSRYDMPQSSGKIDFDSELSNRLDYKIIYQNWFDLELGGGYGNSYQLPSFYDLHWMEGIQAVGNTDLLPEDSKGWNIFHKVQVAKSYIRLSYNYNKVDNLIRWYKSLIYWKPGNIGTAEIRTFQVQSDWQIWQDIVCSFSWQRTIALNKTLTAEGYQSDHFNKNLIYTPTSQLDLNVTFPYYNFKLITGFSRTGRQWTTDDNRFPAIEAYKLWESKLTYGYKIKSWSFSSNLAVHNLLDETYESTDLVPKPGRNWSSGLGINYKF